MEMEQGWFERYSNAAYVDLGFYDTEEHKAYTQQCAQWLGWNCEILSGNPQLIVSFLEGNWDPGEFLVVEPGESVIASHDEKIIAARGCS